MRILYLYRINVQNPCIKLGGYTHYLGIKKEHTLSNPVNLILAIFKERSSKLILGNLKVYFEGIK